MPNHVIVVGAGASGLMAAGRAAERGASVTLVEASQEPGSKLSLTGGGRGNLAPKIDIETCLARYYPSGKFLRNALTRWGVPELRRFLAGIGVSTIVDDEQRVYPATQRASDVTQALVAHANRHGVELHTTWRCRELLVESTHVTGIRAHDGREIAGSAVVLATGGVSYPETGSRGDGLRMARALGYRVETPRPGLAPLILSDPTVGTLAGITLPRVHLTAALRSGSLQRTSGPMVFTHRGLSGPAALDLSLQITRDLVGGPVRIELDLSPSMSADLDEHLAQQRQQHGRRRLRNVVADLLPRQLSESLLTRCALDGNKQIAQVSSDERHRLHQQMVAWPLEVSKTGSLKSAMVTVGGIATDEVEPRTMASRRHRGLFFCGELLDVAGTTGGYNLLMAFSTGWVAGDSAAGLALAGS